MPYGKNEQTPVELCHARGVLRQRVDELLRGSGLEAREPARHLSIGNPRDQRAHYPVSLRTGVGWGPADLV
jgi:hypothetical protein